MSFWELTDEQWDYIKPHLPTPSEVGRPRADDRKTINGILYVLSTGYAWCYMPKAYGSHISRFDFLNLAIPMQLIFEYKYNF
jgi:transposase